MEMVKAVKTVVINIAIFAGQTVALEGPIGGGKNTALALLQRSYEMNNNTW